MAPRVDVEDVTLSETDELERLWARDPGRPPGIVTPPQATLTVVRNSPNDFSDRQIYVWVDGEACGKIRYGDSIVRDVAAGPHHVRVFNTLLSRTVTVEVAPGEHARLRCGTGMPAAGWLMMFFLHVTYLRVWLERDV
ncbi:MAG: hypothetical protein ABR606_17330 [Vicinamibacterales bacterium]